MSSRVVSPVFIGRRGELASLGALMDRARAQEPAFAVIGGEAGVGKTRLVREAAKRPAARVPGAHRAVRGAGRRRAAAGAAGGRAADPGPDAAAGGAGRGARPGRAGAGPAAARAARPAPGPGGRARTVIRRRSCWSMVLGVLDRLSATRPVLLVVEDLHWADQSTLDLAAFLIRSLRGSRVLLVATYRSDELHRRHPLRPLLAGWERLRSVDRLELPRFDRGEVSAQLAAILGDDPAPGVTEPDLRPLRRQRLPGRGAGRDGQRGRRQRPAALAAGRAAEPGGRAERGRAAAAARRLRRRAHGPGRAAGRGGRDRARPSCTRRCARRSRTTCC